jgi:hypothetical protein
MRPIVVNILLQIWRWLISFTRRGRLESEMEMNN